MTMTVLDSTDLPAILADAGVVLDEGPAAGAEATPDTAGKKVGEAAAAAVAEDADDIEGDDGLTPRQKREYTANMQKAIGKKHRMVKEAEEFAAAQYNERKLADERAARLESENAELKAKLTPAPTAPQAPEKPQRENFQDEYAYVEAMIQYGVDVRLREKAEEDAQATAEREKQERANAIGVRIDRAKELVPDFEETVSADDTHIPKEVAVYLESSDMVAELAYYFAKNPDVLLSLAKLTPHQQLVKIGKIESTLSPFEPKAAQNDGKSSKEVPNGQPPKAAPSADTGIDLSKPRGKAAPVITPLDGTGSAGVAKDSKDMNIRESIEDFSKRNRINLGMRKRH